MRAVVQDRYGPPEVLTIAEVPVPVPRDGEMLIRVHAASVSQTDRWLASRWLGDRHLTFASGQRSKADVIHLRELIKAGAYRPVVDRTYPMTAVVDAHRYVEAWHKAGNVVLLLEPG
jgi:NADPH:quinone reductase-like Zn-dependent oxidoreductase